jgi:two-component system response regulator AtoC
VPVKRILVVDDERRARRVAQIMLEELGFESIAAESGEAALRCFESEKIDLVLTDMRMPGMTGIELLTRLRALDGDVPVIVMTAYGTVQSAVEAMKRGAFDYILRPFDVEALEAIIGKAFEMRRYRTENRYLREQIRQVSGAEKLLGDSAVMRRVSDLIAKVAPTKSSVLITGETGTGKELVARAIHDLSPRASKLFVALNCAAIPVDLLESELFGHTRGAFTGAQGERLGKFEVADGGTLFLDEIGDMPYALQAKLLRVLQEGVIEPLGTNRRVDVDVRVVSSTNRDLVAAMAERRFREDLFYRLNVFHVDLPPLRERSDDIETLARSFLGSYCLELGKPVPALGVEALRILRAHRWPGNVRELRNLMERAAVLCASAEIDAPFFRSLMPQAEGSLSAASGEGEDGLALEPAVEALERRMILRALGATGDNKVQAARLLEVSERTLWYKLKKYGL